MANAAHTPKFDPSAIMKAAWFKFAGLRSLGMSFADCLRSAWREAKARLRKEAALAGPNGARIKNLREQLEALQYKGLRYSIESKASAIRAEISKLEAA